MPLVLEFYIPMNLHYSQTDGRTFNNIAVVLYPYEFTLLSNIPPACFVLHRFYIPMNLHYSQTGVWNIVVVGAFYIPMNLHYSQTSNSRNSPTTAV